MNEITHFQEDDDGYSGSITSGRLIKGQILRWNETGGWLDRDGLRPPEVMLAMAVSEALQRWQGKKPIETISVKPLPNIEELNAAVPASEWEPGLDGKPKPPWVHQALVYLLDPASAAFFTYLNSTIGARMAVEQLREKVITMRTLRGTRVVPVVKLAHRPMKTSFGMKHRPEFEVLDWKILGGDGGGSLTGPQTPRLSGPTPSAPETKVVEEKPLSDPKPTFSTRSAANATLSTLETVAKPTRSEEMGGDAVPW